MDELRAEIQELKKTFEIQELKKALEIQELKSQIELLNVKVTNLESENRQLITVIEARDLEINRLNEDVAVLRRLNANAAQTMGIDRERYGRTSCRSECLFYSNHNRHYEY